jgi:hypothetical protein
LNAIQTDLAKDPEEMITIFKAAEIMDCAASTLYMPCRRGIFKHEVRAKKIFIRLSDIEKAYRLKVEYGREWLRRFSRENPPSDKSEIHFDVLVEDLIEQLRRKAYDLHQYGHSRAAMEIYKIADEIKGDRVWQRSRFE